MNIHNFGPHSSKDKDVLTTLNNVKTSYNCSAAQIFIGNPQGCRISQKTVDNYLNQAPAIRNFIKSNNFNLIIHSPYTLNFGTNPDCDDPYWVDYLFKELSIANELTSIGCVLHMGKANSKGIKNTVSIAETHMIKSISKLLDRMHENNMTTKLIIETCAGQGSELFASENNSIEPLIRLWNSFTSTQQKYLGFCVDTCHIHSAGYSIDTIQNIDTFFENWNNTIGINNLTVVHLNNSNTPYNSHVDRHGTLTSGSIPTECLLHFASKCFINHIPIILETIGDFHSELSILTELSKKTQSITNPRSLPIYNKINFINDKSLDDIKQPSNIEICHCCNNNNNNEFNVSKSQKLLFVDLGYLFHYRYHATRRNLICARKDTEDENILHDTFINHLEEQLSKLTKKLKLTKNEIFFCKDARKHTFWRTELYPDYKANRGTADDLCLEWQYEMYDIVKKYGNFLELEHSEADDIVYLSIKTIQNKYPNKEIIILSSDRDYYQILDRPNIKLMDGSGKETIGTNTKDAQKHLWIKILTGDITDNIPPVIKGCGPKTAEKLIDNPQEFKQWIIDKRCNEQIIFNRQLVAFHHIPQTYINLFSSTYKFL
jgi:deoxyribonuclease-4